MLHTLFNTIFGQKPAFPVNINDTQTVGKLKRHIKTENVHALNSTDTDTLMHEQVMQDISQKEVNTLKEELTNPSRKSSAKFGQSSTLAEESFHIPVQPPLGQSIDPIDPSVCDAVIETVLTCPVYLFIYFLWEREGMRHAPSRLNTDVEDSIRARQIGLGPLDGSALCPTP